MKRILIIASVAAAVCSCSGSGYKVSGNIDGFTGEKVYLVTDSNVLSAADVKGGKFSFAGNVATMDKVYVTNSENLDAATVRIPFYLERGTVKIVKKGNGAVSISGTPGNDAIAKFHQSSADLVRVADNALTMADRKLASEKYYELMKSYALKNLDNVAGLEFLAQIAGNSLDGDELIDTYNKCSDAIKATAKWNDDFTYFNHRNNIIKGSYIDFTQPSVDGEMVSVKSVVENPANKFVLVDFWASWSDECMAEILPMSAAYAKYHAKGLEIISSSLDMSEKAWKDAVSENNIKWIEVSDMQYWRNFGAALYAVRTVPANFLIDCSTGKIIAHNLGGADLQKKMSELLGE